VVDEDAEYLLEVTAVEDQQPVEAFGADGADEPFGDRAFALGARIGVLSIRMPSLRKISSKGPVYLLSRSRIRNRTP
jgi:hypothetical protein